MRGVLGERVECVMYLLNCRMKWVLDVEQQPLPPDAVANCLGVKSSADLRLDERASSESLLRKKDETYIIRAHPLLESGGRVDSFLA